MVERYDEFDECLLIGQTFPIKLLLFRVSEYVTVTFVKILIFKVVPINLLHYIVYHKM